MSRTGYIVFAHGSRIESANQAVRSVAAGMARQGRLDSVVAAFLEGGTPDLSGAVDRLAESGLDRIVVIPYFLTLGTHLQRDLPVLATAARERHPGITIEITAPLDGHPAMVEALLDRALGAA
jgi:sirohydrochlorin ferrochelatase